MAEELVLNIKSNIKSVTKQTKDWQKALEEVNQQIEIQGTVINDLDKDLIKLKAEQDKIPKGAWVKGMDKLNDKIKKTSTELKLEKNALTGLKQEQSKAAKEVKKFTDAQKESDKAVKDSIGSFTVMGVSLNGIKSSMGKIIPAAKAMFGSIKAGIMSTGIGALLIAFGSLATFFTSTKRGADQLDKAFTAMGAVVDVLTDRLSKVGEAISFVFSGEFRKAGDALKGTFAGITEEIGKEVAAMTALKQRTQDLRDADMEFMVQKAATRQEIEKARLNAEDETKSASERLAALKTALELEEKTTQRELELAAERLAIQQQEMALSENSAEDEQKLADLKVALIEKETASVKMRRRVVTEVNSLEREILAEEKARAKEKQDLLDAENKKAEEEIKKAEERAKKEGDVLLLLQQENTLALIENLQERALAELKIQEDKEIASAELMENAELVKEQIRIKYAKKREDVSKKTAKSEMKWSEMTKEQKLDTAQQAATGLAKIAGEETAAGKALAVAGATISTYSAATAALAPPPVGAGPILGPVFAGVAIATGLSNIQKILSAGGGGGGGGGSISAPATTGTQPPAPQMMSGDFSIGGLEAPEPVKAFVVTDEMTNSQNQLADIRRRATI